MSTTHECLFTSPLTNFKFDFSWRCKKCTQSALIYHQSHIQVSSLDHISLQINSLIPQK
uniref:Uncharacterized protein n=1 Tax=Rhizophora mucronata TaxID=61149 RepID=A0A2P2NGM8_RHIMU